MPADGDQLLKKKKEINIPAKRNPDIKTMVCPGPLFSPPGLPLPCQPQNLGRELPGTLTAEFWGAAYQKQGR